MSFFNGKLHGFGVSQDAYLAQTAKRGEPGYIIGRSDLHEIACCPWKWLNASGDDDSTESTEWGTLLDAMLFGGDMEQFAVCPETCHDSKGVVQPFAFTFKEAKDWREAQGNKIIVKADVMAEARKAAAQFRSDPEIAKMLQDAKFQAHVTADWTDAETGIVIPCKGLIDIVPSESGPFCDSLADGKTCRNGAAGAWARVCFDGWYHVQGALYLDLWNATGQKPRCSFRHAIEENVKPYAVGRRDFSEQFLRFGKAQYEAALKIYATCLKTGEWPGMDEPGTWTTVELEPWMMMRAGIAPTDAPMPEMQLPAEGR